MPVYKSVKVRAAGLYVPLPLDFSAIDSIVYTDTGANYPFSYSLEDYDLIELEQATRAKLTVSGTSGYPNWTFFSIDVLQSNLTDSELTFQVNNAGGADIYGNVPAYSQLKLIAIDNELMLISSVDYETNIISVERGINGFTAAEHSAGTQIRIYQPYHSIKQAALAIGALTYRRKDTLGAGMEFGVSSNGVIIASSGLPDEITDLLERDGLVKTKMPL